MVRRTGGDLTDKEIRSERLSQMMLEMHRGKVRGMKASFIRQVDNYVGPVKAPRTTTGTIGRWLNIKDPAKDGMSGPTARKFEIMFGYPRGWMDRLPVHHEEYTVPLLDSRLASTALKRRAVPHSKRRLGVSVDWVMPNRFAFQWRDDTMSGGAKPLGEGVMLIVDLNSEVNHGDIVLAVVGDELTLRRFTSSAGLRYLVPTNTTYAKSISFAADAAPSMARVIHGIVDV